MADKPPTDADPGAPAVPASETGKKKRGRPRGKRLTIPQLREQLSKVLALANNLILKAVSPADELTAEEIDILAEGVAEEIDASPRLRAYMQKMGAVGAHGKLIYAVVIIAYPRLVRRGILPAPTGAPAPVEAGGASVVDRGHGNGEIDPTSPAPFGPRPHDSTQDESRPGEVSRQAS